MLKKDITILLADDHPIILQGTKALLEENGYTINTLASNGADAYSSIERDRPMIAILDVSMPRMSGIEVAKLVFQKNLSTKIILLTMHNEYNIYSKAMEYNVQGYLLKNFSNEEILECMDQIIQGEKYHSPKIQLAIQKSEPDKELEKLNLSERKIIELIGKNLNNKEIGELLFISERTVEWHRRNIIEKLELPKEKNILIKWTLQHFSDKNNFWFCWLDDTLAHVISDFIKDS